LFLDTSVLASMKSFWLFGFTPQQRQNITNTKISYLIAIQLQQHHAA